MAIHETTRSYGIAKSVTKLPKYRNGTCFEPVHIHISYFHKTDFNNILHGVLILITAI
jgi:hypothetical protein